MSLIVTSSMASGPCQGASHFTASIESTCLAIPAAFRGALMRYRVRYRVLSSWAWLGLAGCGGDLPAPPAPGRHRRRGPSRDHRVGRVTGRLEAVDAVEIRPRVSGYLRRVAVHRGEGGPQGRVLFEIDPRPYQASWRRPRPSSSRARTRLSLAERDVERAERLVAAQAISQEEYRYAAHAGQAEGEAAVRAAEAAVATGAAQPRVDRGPLADRAAGSAGPR